MRGHRSLVVNLRQNFGGATAALISTARGRGIPANILGNPRISSSSVKKKEHSIILITGHRIDRTKLEPTQLVAVSLDQTKAL